MIKKVFFAILTVSIFTLIIQEINAQVINPYARLLDPLAITYIDSLYPQKNIWGINDYCEFYEEGSGIITHIWTTYPPDKRNIAGSIKIWIDDSLIISKRLFDFFELPDGVFRPPFDTTMSGGLVSNIQIPYRHNFRIILQTDSSSCCVFWTFHWRPLPLELVPKTFSVNLETNYNEQLKKAEELYHRNIPQVSSSNIEKKGSIGISSQSTSDILEIRDEGIIRRMDFQLDDYSQDLLDSLYLEVFWDGMPKPAINTPIGDFFSASDGLRRVNAYYIKASSENGFTAFFPMPFLISARFRIVNRSHKNVNIVFRIHYSQENVDRNRNGYFYACFDQVINGVEHLDVSLSKMKGAGKYIGCNLNFRNILDNYGYLEADPIFSIDSSTQMQYSTLIRYSGTEDYFNGGFAFSDGPFSLPFAGCPAHRTTMYRFHTLDAFDFKKSFEMRWQHGLENDYPVDYRVVSYFYKKVNNFWVEDDTIRIGNKWSISGNGYGKSEPIRIYIDSTLLYSTNTDSDGSFIANIELPLHLLGGLKVLRVNDQVHDIPVLLLEHPQIYIVRDSLPHYYQYIDSILVSGYGFEPSEIVNFQLDTFGIPRSVSSDSDGKFQTYLPVVPVDSGKHTILAKGSKSSSAISDSILISRTIAYEFENLEPIMKDPAQGWKTFLGYYPNANWGQQTGFFFASKENSNKISFVFHIPVADTFQISAFFTLGAKCGKFKISIDGVSIDYFDGYKDLNNNYLIRSPNIDLGQHFLNRGKHLITFEGTGKNPKGMNANIITDKLILTPITQFYSAGNNIHTDSVINTSTSRAEILPNPYYLHNKELEVRFSHLIEDELTSPLKIELFNSLGQFNGLLYDYVVTGHEILVTLPENCKTGYYLCRITHTKSGITERYVQPLIIIE